MSESSSFSSSTCTPQASAHQDDVHTGEPRGNVNQQMAQSQDGPDVGSTPESFCLRPAAVNRRHKVDGSGPAPLGSEQFCVYLQRSSDGAEHCLSPFSRQQDVFVPDECSFTHRSSCELPTSWDQYNRFQPSYSEAPSVPAQPPCLLSQRSPSYDSSRPLLQDSPQPHVIDGLSSSSKYSLESDSTPSHQSLFPKPIYSYSILIFMALRNSKTGSLPVSEIYNFMTEHFPYFKTAPDGWKNSVRHNLSLNKCFEKVENKNGGSSRKGCLWALNPAKVEKMQEEIHKWRRKDPLTVRRSMARPEDLDHLLGERPHKLRCLPPYPNAALISRFTPKYGSISTSCTQALLLRRPRRRPQYTSPPAPSQQLCFLSNSLAPYSPCGQYPSGLNSPSARKMPRAPQWDMMLEGDSSYEVDTLNPSLIDLQLQGNLWEELREDSLATDPQVSSTSLTSALQEHPSCAQVSEAAPVGRCRAEYTEDTGKGQSFEQHGLHPGVYSGVDSLTGYLTCCAASISLV